MKIRNEDLLTPDEIDSLLKYVQIHPNYDQYSFDRFCRNRKFHVIVDGQDLIVLKTK